MDILQSIAISLLTLYLMGVMIKTTLMLATINVAVGTYQRLYARDGLHLHAAILTSFLLVTIPWAALRWPTALLAEGFGFFGVYSRRQTIRDCLCGYNAAHHSQ